MTLLLYDYYELEERASRHLKAWKVWHLLLYTFAAVFGIVNYVFLHKTMELVDGHCVLYPRKLEYSMVDLSAFNDTRNEYSDNSTDIGAQFMNKTVPNETSIDGAKNVTRGTLVDVNNTEIVDENVTVQTSNATHREMLDTSRTLFEQNTNCDFANYMPIMSTVFACVWATMFTMCAGGGHVRTGLQKPWRILTPALLFALVMVGLTGHSFTLTNGGLHDFCAAFYEVTNTTTCSAVNQYLVLGWNATWSMSGRVAATRAASAAVWASWACAAALLLTRCLAAPDFRVKRTAVYLKDPQKKIIPHLKKSSRQKRRSNEPNNCSPTKCDTASVKSEPTIITELVTASIEQGQDSVSSSLNSTPFRAPQNRDMIEMTYTTPELTTTTNYV